MSIFTAIEDKIVHINRAFDTSTTYTFDYRDDFNTKQ